MNFNLKHDENRLHIFHESKKRRIFVAELVYDKTNDIYILTYSKKYARSRNAISLGPDLSLFQLRHQSSKGKLFPPLLDRIPDQENPAYKDYCESQGISVNESNPIILLGTIGKRGPSSFIFEPVYISVFTPVDIIQLREKLQITQHDFSQAFDLSKATLQRVEAGTSQDANTLKRLEILLTFPEVALWQLQQTGNRIHRQAKDKLLRYFQQRTS